MTDKKFYFHLTYLPEGQSFSMLARNINDSGNYDVQLSSKYDPENFDLDIKEDFRRFYALLPQMNNEIDVIVFGFLKANVQTAISFLDYHLKRYSENGENPGNFLQFIKELIINKFNTKLSEGRRQNIADWIQARENELKDNLKPVHAGEKIKWKGTPSQFGYLFLELVKQGFIEPPMRNGEYNYKGLARICYDYFDIESKPEKKTTPENLAKELNPESNRLSDTKRAKFTIPDKADLG